MLNDSEEKYDFAECISIRNTESSTRNPESITSYVKCLYLDKFLWNTGFATTYLSRWLVLKETGQEWIDNFELTEPASTA